MMADSKPLCTCGNPAKGRCDYPWLCWGCTPENRDAYPVLVTFTERHVVWVAAEDQEAAVMAVECEPWEYIDPSETQISADCAADGPRDEFDWEDVYEGGHLSYEGLACDAHVTAWRRHLRSVEVEAAELVRRVLSAETVTVDGAVL